MESESFGSVIVEPRKHPALLFVMSNVLNRTPSDSKMILYHGTTNGSWIRDLLAQKLSSKLLNRIEYRSCEKENLTIKDYNHLFLSKDFWESIPFQKILIFQTDSMILSQDFNELKKFFIYPYIGAPVKSWGKKVGNGGFSLRDKSFCLQAISELSKNQNVRKGNEDNFFSHFLYFGNHKFPIPTFYEGKTFSVETIYYPKPFAIHKCWNYFTKVEWNQFIKDNPEAEQLKNLQIKKIFSIATAAIKRKHKNKQQHKHQKSKQKKKQKRFHKKFQPKKIISRRFFNFRKVHT